MKESIAIVFDFDDTLAPDSTNGFLVNQGVDTTKFWSEVKTDLIDQGWDPVPAYLFHMIAYAKKGAIDLSQKSLTDWGKTLQLHMGVEQVFASLREAATSVNPNIKLEFYLVSSGIGDVLRHTAIAHWFTEIWSSEFYYDDNGEAVYSKKIVSFTDKTRYLFHVQKGLIGSAFKNNPFCVNKKVSAQDIRIPLDQMIVVGDGYTDIPMFSLIQKNGGTPIGVYDKSNTRTKWEQSWEFIQDGRVANLVSANYQQDSDLCNILTMAVKSLCNRITLAQKTYQG